MDKKTTSFENDRYGSLRLINWFDINIVQKAKVLVVGAGAIGNEVIKNLALLGVGNVFIYDRDTIEMSNLTRSILFRSSDCNQLKSETAARKVKDINPDINVKWFNGDIRIDLGLGFIRRMDVIIGCLDNVEARLKINADCFKLDKPWIDGGIGQFDGQVQVFLPQTGICYECGLTEEDLKRVTRSCGQLSSMYAEQGKIPTTPTIASIIAGVQVQEMLKLLDFDKWHGQSLAGRDLSFNGTSCYVDIAGLPSRDDCWAHQSISDNSIIELPKAAVSKTKVAELLKIIENYLGDDVSFDLNFELVIELFCKKCNESSQILKPWNKMFQEDLICTKCDSTRDDLTTHTIDRSSKYFDLIKDKFLEEICIPPLDILKGFGSKGVAHFELTGDEDLISNNN